MNALQITLHGLATTSLLVSLLIAAFLPLRPLLHRVIGSRWLCLLWLALLMRLLMPWPLESRWSMFNRWQTKAAPSATAQEPVTIKVRILENVAPENSPIVTTAPTAHTPALSMNDLAGILWLSGFAASLCILAWRWQQTRRLAAGTRPATDERLLHIFSSIPPKLRCDVELKMTNALHVPTLAGVIRPQIWMPQSWLAQFSDDELRNVLLHELGHARRGDLIVQWLFAFAQCIHWFNPLVWLAARAARFDREMACDAWVLGRCGGSRDGYGLALVKAVQLLREPLNIAPAGVAMALSRRSLRARISGIGAFRPLPTWRGASGFLLMLATLAALTTSRSTAADGKSDGDGSAPTKTPGTVTAGDKVKQLFIEAHRYYDTGHFDLAYKCYDEILQIDPYNVAARKGREALAAKIKDAGQANNTAATPVPDEKTTAVTSGTQIAIESKFVDVTEEVWKKLCGENPAFKDFNSKFPELAHEKTSYADLKDKLTKPEKGAWELPTGKIEELSLISYEDFTKIIRSFNQTKDVDLLSAPSVTTKASQRAVIEILREFRYPSEFQDDKDAKPEVIKTPAGETRVGKPPRFTPTAFVTKNIGVTLEVQPNINKDGTIELKVVPTVSGFLGFLTEKDGVKILDLKIRGAGALINRPVFSTSTGKITQSIQPGQTILLGAVRLDYNGAMLQDITGHESPERPHPDAAPETVRHVLLVFVTPHIVADEGPPVINGHSGPTIIQSGTLNVGTPNPSSAGHVENPKFPSGIPVKGKEGFVTSPYSPDAGMIDVRGFKTGTQVKDPYSGKIFLVP